MSIHLEHTEWDIVPQEGSYIELDNDTCVLLDYDETEWELCQWRVKAGRGLYHLAVNVDVTGWTLQTRSGAQYIRVALTYVADPLDVDLYTGERMSEDEVIGGWMLVTDKEKVRNEEKAERLWAEARRIAELQAERDRQEREALEAEAWAENEARDAASRRRPDSRAAALEL